jgi:two-component system, sensor histidine kinase and response regulator
MSLITTPPSRILAVDDVPDNLLLIEGILEEEGYEIQCVESGAKALEVTFHRPPDFILLDIMMPDMDGYEVTRQIRQTPNLTSIAPALGTGCMD